MIGALKKLTGYGPVIDALLAYLGERAVENDEGCWIWKLRVGKDSQVPMLSRRRYKPDGETEWGGCTVRRAIIEDIAQGPMPENYVSALLCKNRRCVNPLHTMATTKTKQAEMAAEKGVYLANIVRARSIAQAKARDSKYSDELVEYVRNSEKSGRQVAKEVGMSQVFVSLIRRNMRRAAQTTPFTGLGARE